MNRMNPDIHIVGAGLWGLALAYELSLLSPQRSITLWDRCSSPARGISSLAASLITTLRSDRTQVSLAQQTLQRVHQFEKDQPGSTGWKPVGSVYLCNDLGTEALCSSYDQAVQHNLRVEWLEPKGVRTLVPWLEPSSWTQAIWLPDEGYVDAYLLAQCYWERAKSAGVKSKWSEGIDRLIVHDGQLEGFVTQQGEKVHASCVVLATGPWTNPLLTPHGMAVPIAPVRSQYWITAKHEQDFASDSAMAFYPQHRWYVRPESGALLFGVRESQCIAHDARQLPTDITRYVGDTNDPMGLENLRESYETLISCIPALQSKGLAHHISGPSTYTHDGQPTIGPMNGAQGLWVATGCNGSGVAYSAGIAQQLANALSEADTRDPYAKLPSSWNPNRIDQLDPYDSDFLLACAQARSQKHSG